MRILYYHWVPFYEYKKTGGGIAVYMNNLVRYLCKNTKHNITCLCSGYKWHPYKKKAYIQQTHNPCEADGCQTWEIINSPIMAPAAFHDRNPKLAFSDNEASEIFVDFVRSQGGFDVIHFHSMEGIPPQILEKLKKNFPDCRLVFSVHDYHSVCPGIRLFQQNQLRHCADYCNGKACMDCTIPLSRKTYFTHLARYIRDEYNKPPFAQLIGIVYRRSFIRRNWDCAHSEMATAEDYVRYRSTFVNYLNNYVDVICPVSKRTGEVMIERGIRPELMKTLYIGTNAAEKTHNCQAYMPDNFFTIVFIGYATAKIKGFSFLMKALSMLSPEISKKLRLVVAARGANKMQIRDTLSNLADVITYNGYNHEQLAEILKDCNLGIVPVIWEDNLPQVAIEMVAHGIPILCSDMGGASELSEGGDFRFQAGNVFDFQDKLSFFINNPDKLLEYWKGHIGLMTMEKHVKELEKIYVK